MNCFFAILLIVLIYRCLPSGFLPSGCLPSYFRAFRVFRGSLFPLLPLFPLFSLVPKILFHQRKVDLFDPAIEWIGTLGAIVW